MKTEVYSWRVSTELKQSLEREARNRKISVSAVLDLAAKEWLEHNRSDSEDEAEQARVHRLSSHYFGIFAGNDPQRSQKVSESVKKVLKRRHAD